MPRLTNYTFKLLLSLVIVACEQKSESATTKTVDFELLTIEVPKSWQEVKRQGIDSDVGGIAIDQVDTINFDVSPFAYTLPQRELRPLTNDELQQYKYMPDEDLVIVTAEDLRGPRDFDRYKMESLVWDTVDNREVKIIFPRKAGQGHTGVYMDSLWGTGRGRMKFSLYGTNLKPENQKAVLSAIETIKFKVAKNDSGAHNSSLVP